MIQKIDKINHFGIFNNFVWNSIPDIEDFKEKNILYGWNYSGKTTLSRLFSSLKNKSLHPDYSNASFRILYDTGIVDETNLASFPYPIEVFNSDYITENLRWGYDENINAIFFEVGENAKISEKINILNNLINNINGTDSIKGKKDAHLKAIEVYQNFEDQFTDEARRIKNESFLSLIEFNKSHLKKIKDNIIYDLEKFIITSKEELKSLNLVVKIKEPKEKLNAIAFDSCYSQIILLTKEVLSSVPTKSEIIELLDKKKGAFEWTKNGLSLHSKGENCIFCGNLIADSRYDTLIQYFNNQSSKLKERIKEIFLMVSKEEELIYSIIIPQSVNDFNDNYKTEFQRRKFEFDREIKRYQNVLKKIKSLLTQKNNVLLYSAVSITIKESDLDVLLEKIKQINEIISSNNLFSDNFKNIILSERDKYKAHLVASFLKSTKYLSKERKSEKATLQVRKLDDKIQTYLKEISRLNSQRESDSEGCAQYNSFVQSFLSRDDIEIKLNPQTKKFNLMRGAELAQNLSEGEKMAISFSHYLVNLKSIDKKGKLNDYIIFIDDPISSLDSNHVFQINSLLKEMFFERIPNPDIRQKDLIWVIKCKQIFISTHNFEFFNLLKEVPKTHGLGKKESRYLISRNFQEAIIENLPKVYNSFSSEYHFLYSEIVDFDKDPNKNSSPKLLLMPNILRRFVEIYTLTKYPSNEEVDHRADEVFGKYKSKRILKPLHYFSHFNNIDRIGKQSELIADVSNATRVLLDFIKDNDKMHLKALNNAIN